MYTTYENSDIHVNIHVITYTILFFWIKLKLMMSNFLTVAYMRGSVMFLREDKTSCLVNLRAKTVLFHKSCIGISKYFLTEVDEMLQTNNFAIF